MCFVDYDHNSDNQQLTRRIVTFRKTRSAFRRQEEIHRQQLYQGTVLAGGALDEGYRTCQNDGVSSENALNIFVETEE